MALVACESYRNKTGGELNDGSACRHCGVPASGHKDYPGNQFLSIKTDGKEVVLVGANERQVGGEHYKTGGEEHWDRVHRLGLDYFQGQITKYVERAWKKNGVEDLKKARHFLDKYIELKEGPIG